MRPRKFVRSTALVLVLTAALTVTAFAADPTQQPATKTDNKSSYYPTSVEMTEDDAGNPMIRKTYQLSVSDDPQKLPVADFERDGRRYYLLDMTKEDKIGVDTKEHSETVKLSSDTKEMEQILQRLDAQKEVTTEDGHTGVLTLDHTSVKVTADGYGTKKRTLSATRTYPNLSDADVALIPKTIQDNGHTLTLADVQWDSAYQTEADEAVVRCCATAQYTGESSSQYVTGYTVTADYSGKVTKTSCDTAEQPVEETDHRLPIVLGGAALLGAMLGGAATRIKKKKERGTNRENEISQPDRSCGSLYSVCWTGQRIGIHRRCAGGLSVRHTHQ